MSHNSGTKMLNQIYYFLIKFPVYGKLLAAFEDDTTSCTDIFPLGKPFKCLYAIYALRDHLAGQIQQVGIMIIRLNIN